MITDLMLPILCNKYDISCILFTKDFKIVEFTNNIKDFVNDTEKLFIDGDVRDSLWELIGFEEELEEIYSNKKDYLNIPMLLKKEVYYDINVETCITEKNEKLFIAMFFRQSNLSMSYLSMIQKMNHENLKYEYEKENIENSQNYFDLINQKLISFHLDRKGIITEVNEACLSFFGLEKSMMVGKHFSSFFFSREVKVSSTKVSNILRATNLNKVDVFFHTDIIPVKSHKDISQNIIICQDITYLKKIESELEYAVNHDSLTGLPNRLMLRKKIAESILESKKTKESFALCFIDLNKFKDVNDDYGHHVGDMLLKHVGEVISNIIRDEDIIARIGGDEFIILFKHIESLEYLETTLKRIDTISKKSPLFYTENLTIPLTFSLGVSIYPQDGEDIETLLNSADKKMYEEKKTKV